MIISRQRVQKRSTTFGVGDPAYTATNFRGYIVPQVAGSYTAKMINVDEIALFWHASKAYSGWTRSNADAVDDSTIPPQRRASHLHLPPHRRRVHADPLCMG